MLRAAIVVASVSLGIPALAQTGVYMDRQGNFSSQIGGNGISPPAPSGGYGEVYQRRYIPPGGDGFTYQDRSGNGISIRNNVRPACREVVYRNSAGGITRELSCDPS